MVRSNIFLFLVVIIAIIASIGVAVFLAYSSEGEISVDDRIKAVDHSTLTTEVNTETAPQQPNGGLVQQQGASENPAPTAPAPEPEPAAETASTTEAAPEGGEVAPAPETETEPAPEGEASTNG